MKTIQFKSNKNYKNLYFFLKDKGLSESLISFLRNNPKTIFINGQASTIKTKIYKKDKITLNFYDNTSTKVPYNNMPLNIIFENDDLLIIDKPAGIPTIPSKRHYDYNLAGAVCKYMCKKQQNFVFRVEGRLDKDTSGLVLITKNQLTSSMIKYKKEYVAICHGTFKTRKFTIDSPILTIKKNNINQQQRVINENGKKAITHVKVLKSFDNLSLIQLSLEQGRTHQIRLHMSKIKHPLLGDKLYGIKDNVNSSLLHCHKMEVKLPFYKKPIKVKTDLPKDFTEILKNRIT